MKYPIAARGPPVKRRVAFVISFIGLGLMSFGCVPTQKKEAGKLPETPDAFVAKFGQPDSDESGENEEPLPLMPIRALTYKKQNVQALYHPTNTEFPVKLPISGWKLIQYQDNKTNKIISHEEAAQRMARESPAQSQPTQRAVKEPSPMAALSRTPEGLIERFGKPDEDQTSESTTPVPQPVRRWLVYQKQNVYVLFAGDGATRPVKTWELIEFLDNEERRALEENDVIGLLSERDSERKRFDAEMTAFEQAKKNTQSKVAAAGDVGRGAKTVHVKAYTTKNGVNVPAHTRSVSRR